ncbi:Rha family transcriptional regulator [Parasediminibacterium sp. JCM 36343]|uniref:Rha family transcriptional regulator n=1 Tax=Parasediminibacterium sp. JCM 36343 TaxID=3374279 RepID=UPI003979C91A
MQLVIKYKDHVSTTSVLVAEKFGKRHDDVLRAIRNMECSEEFSLRNFAESDYLVRGKKYPMYILTRDAFTMLVMSFTGGSAAKFREEFIDEFNRMEEVLKAGETPVLIATYQQRVLSEPTKSCPDTHWNIFDASHSIMLLIEKGIGSINKYDLADGSIGTRWAKFRTGKEWAVDSSTYMHEYEDNRGARECKCYQYSERAHFNKWLRDTYKTVHLSEYLITKYKGEKNIMMLDRVQEFLPKLLRAS